MNELSEQDKERVTRLAIETLFGKMEKLPIKFHEEFLTHIATAAIGTMRGTSGDKFTVGFLRAALADARSPKGLCIRRQTLQ